LPELTAEVDDAGIITATVRVSDVPAHLLSRVAGGALQARLLEVAGDDPAFWPEIAVADLEATTENAHVASIRVTVPPWTRTGLAVAVRYPAEPTLEAGIGEVPSEVRGVGPDAEHGIPSPWGPCSVPVWVDVAGEMPTVAFEPVAGGDIRATVTGAGTGWQMQLLAGTNALVPTGPPIAASDGLLIPAGQKHAMQLRDPFGQLHAPVLP
jgi:hypothetical protein